MQLIDLLLGDLIAGIDFERALELNESSVEIAALDEDAAAVDVSGRGLESHAREVLFVTQVVRPQIDGVLVVGKGGVVILVRFGGLPGFVPRFGGLGGFLGFLFGGLGVRRRGANGCEAQKQERKRSKKDCR